MNKIFNSSTTSNTDTDGNKASTSLMSDNNSTDSANGDAFVIDTNTLNSHPTNTNNKKINNNTNDNSLISSDDEIEEGEKEEENENDQVLLLPGDLPSSHTNKTHTTNTHTQTSHTHSTDTLHTPHTHSAPSIMHNLRYFFALLLSPPHTRPALIGTVLAIAGQLSGINAVIMYAPFVVQQIGISTESVFMAVAIIVGLWNSLCTLLSVFLVCDFFD